MIITLTLNPALDKTAELDELNMGGLNRLYNLRVDVGGKGLNVSKCIQALGGDSLAMGFCGGETGANLQHQITALGLKQAFTEIAEETRTNLKILSPQHGVTEFNEPGPHVSPSEITELKEQALKRVEENPGAIFVLSGSLARGFTGQDLSELCQNLKSKSARLFVDLSGEALTAALSVGVDLIKPNLVELMELFHLENTPTLHEIEKYSKRLLADAGNVVISLGPEGALFLNKEVSFYAPALEVPMCSTVGAGDSMLGALALAFERGLTLSEAAQWAMASSAAAVTTFGTQAPDLSLVEKLLEQVRLSKIKNI